MMSDTNISSGSFDDEKVEYQSHDKIPIHIELSKDSTSDLPDFIDTKRKIWVSKELCNFEANYDHSVSVFDVAAYIINKSGSITTMKLQKLVYYSQAWSLVWDDRPLFKEDIEAWVSGPVVRELFNYHRGQYSISSVLIGNSDILNKTQRETIDAVINYYNKYSSQWLSDLAHMEDPWKKTRVGMSELQRGSKVIGLDLLAEYYGSLPPEE